MKCVIVYLLITSNTQKIARTMRAGVQQAVGNCELVRLKDADWRRLQECDLIDIGCPVMGFR